LERGVNGFGGADCKKQDYQFDGPKMRSKKSLQLDYQVFKKVWRIKWVVVESTDKTPGLVPTIPFNIIKVGRPPKWIIQHGFYYVTEKNSMNNAD